jgi:P-type E1-E2 ATPase
LRLNGNSEEKHALVIDGTTLDLIHTLNMQRVFRDISIKCDAVLCCRMSPPQEKAIVRLVKTSAGKPMTCAIGDGANDVSMIQEADVGCAVFGKESLDAARSADFAFAKFKHLRRALLVHGYLYYTRAATLVLYLYYNVKPNITNKFFFKKIHRFF